LPTQWSEQHVLAVAAHETVLKLPTPIAAFAHRLRTTQSPPENVHVRQRMDPVGAGVLRTLHDRAPCGAQAESTQVRSHSGECRSCYPEPHDVQKPRIESLGRYIWPVTGLPRGDVAVEVPHRNGAVGILPDDGRVVGASLRRVLGRAPRTAAGRTPRRRCRLGEGSPGQVLSGSGASGCR
jgi:hypothetical protein